MQEGTCSPSIPAWHPMLVGELVGGTTPCQPRALILKDQSWTKKGEENEWNIFLMGRNFQCLVPFLAFSSSQETL